MRITQGTFSFLPDLTDEQIATQVQYCLDKGWAVNIEYTDDPHPRNTYWEMWGIPLFDIADAAGVMMELAACRKAHAGQNYIRMTAFDSTHGWESLRLSFITDRPAKETGFMLERQEMGGRRISYKTRSYAADHPEGERYSASLPNPFGLSLSKPRPSSANPVKKDSPSTSSGRTVVGWLAID